MLFKNLCTRMKEHKVIYINTIKRSDQWTQNEKMNGKSKGIYHIWWYIEGILIYCLSSKAPIEDFNGMQAESGANLHIQQTKPICSFLVTLQIILHKPIISRASHTSISVILSRPPFTIFSVPRWGTLIYESYDINYIFRKAEKLIMI